MLEPVTHNLEASGALTRRAGTQGGGPEHLPDLLLIERARAGEERAIETLIRRYGRRLFRVARSVLAEDDAAELVVQEACLVAFSDLNRSAPNGKFAAWLTRLAFGQARSLRASLRAAPRAAAPAAAGVAQAAPGAEEPERRELERALTSLPEVFRTVFVLRVVEGISGIETAASLGVHETTVRTRMYRAQRRLPPETARRLRGAPAILELAPERLERIVKRVLAQPHGSLLSISASPP
jgi:RNA polymerase sigma-70 factor, ECF subfamily